MALCKPSSWLFLLPFVLVLFAVPSMIITSRFLSYPVCTSLPYSLRREVLRLQSQVGTLLKDLRTNKTNYNDIKSEVADKILHINISLENIAHRLSSGSSEEPPDTRCNEKDGFDLNEDDDMEAVPVPLVFRSKEAQSYTSPKSNSHGSRNFLGVEAIQPTVGLSCASMPTTLDRYMSYKLYEVCPDDWVVAQKLMLGGCDPLPRRRCFSRSPPKYSRPLPVHSSLWNLPDDSNILWSHYKCKGFSCLTSKEDKGFFKCSSCFDLSAQLRRNSTNSNTSAEFSIDKVLDLKPGEMRVGLDFSISTGNFAATMKERNVTIVTATVNIGAPFNEVIALRGLVPLYVTIGSRLPFFDNTMDMVHSALFLDGGWIQVELLQYVIFDWDRVLRPGGLLWVDRFFSTKKHIERYLTEFQKLGYKKLLWKVVPKTDREGGEDEELFFSAVLEKPVRSSTMSSGHKRK